MRLALGAGVLRVPLRLGRDASFGEPKMFGPMVRRKFIGFLVFRSFGAGRGFTVFCVG